jgi:hypothetical protein
LKLNVFQHRISACGESSAGHGVRRFRVFAFDQADYQIEPAPKPKLIWFALALRVV